MSNSLENKDEINNEKNSNEQSKEIQVINNKKEDALNDSTDSIVQPQEINPNSQLKMDILKAKIEDIEEEEKRAEELQKYNEFRARLNKEIDDEKLRTKEVKDNRYCDCNNKHNKKFGKIRQFKFYELKGADGNIPLIHGFKLKCNYYDDLFSQLNSWIYSSFRII